MISTLLDINRNFSNSYLYANLSLVDQSVRSTAHDQGLLYFGLKLKDSLIASFLQ